MKRDKKGQFVKQSKVNEYFEGFGIWYDKKGYPSIWIDGKSVKIHVFVWERVNGKKPKNYQLHHKDFDKKNYNIDNLELVTQSDHFKIHAGWIRENGEWIKKPCKGCGNVLQLDKFYQRKGLTPSNLCIDCTKIYWKNKLKNNNEFREQRKIYLKEYYNKNKNVKRKKA